MVCFQGKWVTSPFMVVTSYEGKRCMGMNQNSCLCVIPCFVKECYMGAIELLASREQAGLLLDDLC